MKIFITGASGYVGRNLMAHVLQKGDSVVALARSPEASRRINETASGLGYTVSIFEGDLTSSSPEHFSQGDVIPTWLSRLAIARRMFDFSFEDITAVQLGPVSQKSYRLTLSPLIIFPSQC